MGPQQQVNCRMNHEKEACCVHIRQTLVTAGCICKRREGVNGDILSFRTFFLKAYHGSTSVVYIGRITVHNCATASPFNPLPLSSMLLVGE